MTAQPRWSSHLVQAPEDPQDPPLWLPLSRPWHCPSLSLTTDEEQAAAAPLLAPGMDPEQLHLLEEQFDEVDSDGDGEGTQRR